MELAVHTKSGKTPLAGSVPGDIYGAIAEINNKIKSLEDQIAAKSPKVEKLLETQGIAEEYDLKTLNGSIDDFALLVFVYGYIGTAVEATAVIPASRYTRTYDDVQLSNASGDSKCNVKRASATSVSYRNNSSNRVLQIYGVKI